MCVCVCVSLCVYTLLIEREYLKFSHSFVSFKR